MLRSGLSENDELDSVDQRHQTAHELTMTIRLHVGEVSIGVGVGFQQHKTPLLRRVVPVVAESARFVGSNAASLRGQRLDLF